MKQILSDNLIDLEVEYIDRIIDKILSKDSLPYHIKHREADLWLQIRKTTSEGRRTGNGITGLGDMLAALGTSYGSDGSLKAAKRVMYIKMQAELDATIDMAILRDAFEGWDKNLEFGGTHHGDKESYAFQGTNSFFEMLLDEFPIQAQRMYRYGRRNVSWSTVAPTGTVSIMTQTTGGLEPLFKAYYIRRKKINPNDKNIRVDFVDQNGDSWQEYPVLHPKFKKWIINHSIKNTDHGFNSDEECLSNMTRDQIQTNFELSPWYGSEADDISWEKRIGIQSIIQKYTSNAISSTINLPKDVSKETVHGIYLEAWRKGLKGVTIYREGSRTGVLVKIGRA